ncbi:hypothetical protein DC522_28940 [Microvirga sp. KLBC 81]|uniref:hypothetical protein n=1 Tax=Microvirga sp. KLBC 81 TaxID=1862707 RepID=UPI000D512E88|nr:hypothetical protein [Microvirga sp. KLBC 81]PVE21022.1 hypothetical protein DC522_28940 [Microvirga sp. KLBC 81]
MAKRPEEDEQPEINGAARMPHLDRLEKLANTAATAARAKQRRARKNGMHQQEEPSDVRNLRHDDEARAQAEEAMRQMMQSHKASGAAGDGLAIVNRATVRTLRWPERG